MDAILSFASIIPTPNRRLIFPPTHCYKPSRIRCMKQQKQTSTSSTTTRQESEPENALLKIAWYGSEILGIAASFIRSKPNNEDQDDDSLIVDGNYGTGAIDRDVVVESIKKDYERSYFVTGKLILDVYEENCEFADPAGSFKGLQRFKRNCTNFGSLIEKSSMKLMKWEDFDQPVTPSIILMNNLGRHVENWNVPKMTLLKQLLKPSRQKKRKQ